MTEHWLILANGAQVDNLADSCRTIAWDDSCLAERRLSALVHERLLDIRGEHMRWAFEMGEESVETAPEGANFARMLEVGEKPSMWWTSILYERHPKISPNLYPVYKLRALEMLLVEEKPVSLMLAGGNAMLGAALEELCQAYEIPYSYRAGEPLKKRGGLLHVVYRLIPAPFRALLRFAHWWLTVGRHFSSIKSLPSVEPVENGGRKNLAATIVSYFPNIDLKAAAEGHYRSRYWESLHEALNQEAKRERPDGSHFVRWLFIRFPSPQLSLKQCRVLCKTFAKNGRDGLSFNYLEEFLTFKDYAAALSRWLKLCFQSWRLRESAAKKSHFKDSKFNFWRWIKWDYHESFQGWRCLERCLQNRAFQSYFKTAGKQRWNLFPLENCPWERMLTFHARGLEDNGPVFGTQHSMVRPTDFRYFDDPRSFSNLDFAPLQPNVIGGNGSSAIGQWRQNGMPSSHMLQVEALRYLYLAEDKVKQGSFEPFAAGDGEPLEPSAPKGHLLVLTSFFADETNAHLDLVKKCLDKGVFDGWQISLKPHPVFPVNSWLENLPEEQRKRIMLLHTPLANLLESWQFVWTSNSTTAALEAALKGLPVMVMAPMNDFDLCPIQNVPGLPRTATVDDVLNAMRKPAPIVLPDDYLDLSPALTVWRKLLDLESK